MQEFQSIYENNFTRIYRFIYRFLGDRHLAEDLTQETFLKLYGQLNSEQGLSNPRPWLYRVASNLCKNHLKRKKLHQNFEFVIGRQNPIHEKSIENTIIDAEEIQRLRNILKRLSAQDQLLLQLYQEGFSYREISEITNIRFSSVGKKISRAIMKCKEQLSKVQP